MTKRILSSSWTNILIMVTVSLFVTFLAYGHYLTPYGINWVALALFCGIWGMAGAFISWRCQGSLQKRPWVYS
jgi:heat shock protein HtpX